MNKRNLEQKELRHGWLRRGFSLLLCMLTVFSMIQPGLAVSAEEYKCGIEAHTHTDNCYQTVTEMKPVDVLNCTWNAADAHKHTAACYQVLDCEKQLVQPHIHGFGCYRDGIDTAENLICTLEEAHIHDDMMCYTGGKLTCGKKEAHVHDGSCYRAARAGETGKLICTIKTTHTHDSSCYITGEQPVSRSVLKCEKLAHIHSDACNGSAGGENQTGLDTSGFSEIAVIYANLLADLESRITDMQQAGPDAEGYEQLYTDLENELIGLDEKISMLYISGELKWEEFDALYHAELDRISSLFYSDIIPEEEATAYVEKSALDKSLKNQNNGITNGLQVAIAIRKDGDIPGEPSLSGDGEYLFFDQNYNAYTSFTVFNKKPGDVIDPGITSHPDFRFKSVTGSTNVAGLSDGTGEKIMPYLTIDEAKIIAELKKDFSGTVYGVDGKKISGNAFDDYEVICYIIKYQSSPHQGWHIDCALVPKAWVTLSYDMNIPVTHTAASVSVPNAHTVAPGTAVKTGYIQYNKSNLAVGSTIKVKDQDGDTFNYKFLGWSDSPTGSVKVKPGASYTVTKDQTLYAVWETDEYSVITLKKSSTGSYFNASQAFSFTVNGSTYSLKAGGSVNVKVPRKSSVTITETDSANYEVSGVKVDGTSKGAVKTVTFTASGKSHTVEFTNKRKTTSLVIDKVLEDNDGTHQNEQFTVTVSASPSGFSKTVYPTGAQNQTVTGIPVGDTITVTETTTSGYTVQKKLNSAAYSNGASLTYTSGASAATAYFKNTQNGKLQITKTVTNGDTNKEFTIHAGSYLAGKTYTVSGVSGTKTAGTNGAVVLKSGQTATFTQLKVGQDYSVAEQNPGDYNVSYSGSAQSGKIGTDTHVTVTNARKTGTVTVKKVIDNGTSGSFAFEATLTDPYNGNQFPAQDSNIKLSADKKKATFALSHNGTVTFKDLPVGTKLTVTETQTGKGSSYISSNLDYDQEKTIAAGDNGTLTFNNKLLSELNVVKQVVPAAGKQANKDKAFTIETTINGSKQSADLKDGGTVSYDKQHVGWDYSVKETPASHYGYAVTYSANGNGKIASSPVTVTVTNTELTAQINGGIKIEKTLTNADSVARTYYFQVEETAPDGSTKTYDEVAVPVAAGAASGYAMFNTTYYGDALGTDGKATYTYKITELQKADPAIADADKIVWNNSEKTVTVTVDGTTENQLTAAASPASVSFNNTLLSELRIEKKVVGETTEGKNFAMTVELDSNYFQVGETYQFTHSGEGYTFTPGMGRSASITLNITLEPNGYVVIGRVPVGAAYSVSESAQSAYGYAVTYDYSNPSKKLGNSQENVTVTNTENHSVVIDLDDTAGIQIVKELTQSYGDRDHTYNFKVQQVGDTAGFDSAEQNAFVTVEQGETASYTRGVFVYKGSDLAGSQSREIVYKVWETDTDNDMVDIDDDVYYQVRVQLSDEKQNEGDDRFGIALKSVVTAVERIEDPVWTDGVPGGGTLVSTERNSGGSLKFTNIPLGTIRINKVVPADSQTVDGKRFTMDVIIANGQGLLKQGMKFLVNGAEWTVTEANETAKAMTITVPVERDGSVLIEKIPAGSTVSVSETLESSFGYQAEYTVDSVDDTKDVAEYTTTPITGVPLEEKTGNDDSATLTFHVRNTELSTVIGDGENTGIRVIKELLNSDMEEHGPYTFHLTQVKDKDGTSMDADTVAAPAEQADKSLTIEKDKSTGEFRYDIIYDGYMLDTGTVVGDQKTKTFYYLITETTEDDFAVNADEREYVVEVTLTGTLNDMTAAVTGVYELTGDPKTGESLGTGIDAVSFQNLLLGTIEVTKDLPLFEGSTHGDAFKMWLTVEGDYIESDMLFNVNGTDYDYSKQQPYDRAVLEDGKLLIEMDLKGAEHIEISKIPAGSTFTVAENGTGENANHGFDVTYHVDSGAGNRSAAEGTVPAKKASDDGIRTEAVVTNAEQWATWVNGDGADGIRVTKFVENPDNKNNTWEFELRELDRDGNELPGGLHMVTPVTFSGDKGEVTIPVKYKTTDLNDGTIASETKTKHFYYKITEVVPDWKKSTHDPKVYIVTVLLVGKTNSLEAKVIDIELDNQSVDLVNPGVNFTNTLLGSFTLEKQVMTLAGWASSFDFEITSDALDGDYAAELNGKPTTVNFKNGKANVKLRDKDVLRVYEIPHGTEVTIQEYAFDFVIRHKINGGRTNTADHTEQTITTDGVHILYLNYYDKNQLPQTGQLNWPIPVLLGLGAGLVMGGIWLSRKKKKEEE